MTPLQAPLELPPELLPELLLELVPLAVVTTALLLLLPLPPLPDVPPEPEPELAPPEPPPLPRRLQLSPQPSLSPETGVVEGAWKQAEARSPERTPTATPAPRMQTVFHSQRRAVNTTTAARRPLDTLDSTGETFSRVRCLTFKALLLLTALAACHGSSNLTAIVEQNDTFLQNGSNGYTAKFTQPPALVDILFVVNNSPSMCAKQQELVTNFQGVIQSLETEQLDFHIGVTTGDFTDPTFQGNLVAGAGDPTVLTSAALDAGADIAQEFADNVATVGVTGSPDSQPLLAAAVALQEPLVSTTNAGFLRSNAALAIVIVDDQDDYSLALPPANPAEDPMPYYFSRVFLGLKGPGNDGLVTVSAIVGADPQTGLPADCDVQGAADQSCIYSDYSADAANRILAVVSATSGVPQSICQSSFGPLLSSLGAAIGGLSRRFNLSATPLGEDFEASSITVVVTPPGGTAQTISQSDQTGWHYDPTSQSVEFIGSYAPPAGSQILITYATLQASFKLTHPAAPGTITVTVTPQGQAAITVPAASGDGGVGWSYDSGSQSIDFSPAALPPLGATLEVSYEIES
jgi:hypothetical protein